MKRRKKIWAWACVGSHDSPFYCMSGPVPQRIGQLEVYNSKEDALRNAVAPRYVRRVEMFIDRAPSETRDGL